MIQNPAVDSAEARAVRFNTAVPDSLLRANLKLIYGAESISDLNNLTGIVNLSGKRLEDVTGIEYMNSITDLYIGGNNIVLLDNIATLTALTDLRAENCEITILRGIDLLTNLTRLLAYNNKLVETGSVAQLVNLALVNLSSNQLSQEAMESLIDDFHGNSADLGANSCVMWLESNPGSAAAEASKATEIADLNAAGCTVNI